MMYSLQVSWTCFEQRILSCPFSESAPTGHRFAHSWQGLPQGYARMEDALRQLMEKEFEQHIGKIEQSLSAVAMTEEQALELKVPPDTPGFRSVRRYFDLRGRLALVAVTLHPGPQFSYFTRYRRSDLVED